MKDFFKNILFKSLSLFILLNITTSLFAQTDAITLTTFYPSPFGSYDRLRLLHHGGVPPAVDCDDTSAGDTERGTLYYGNGTLWICADPGTVNRWQPISGASVWTQNGDLIYPTTTNPNPILDAIRVGIGTQNPLDKLHVIGSVLRISDPDSRWGLRIGETGNINRLDFNFVESAPGTQEMLMYGGNAANSFRMGTFAVQANTVDFRTGTTGMVIADGRLGVGNNSPQTQLHVSAGPANNGIRVENTAFPGRYLQLNGGAAQSIRSTNDLYVFTPTGTGIGFLTNGNNVISSAALRIDALENTIVKKLVVSQANLIGVLPPGHSGGSYGGTGLNGLKTLAPLNAGQANTVGWESRCPTGQYACGVRTTVYDCDQDSGNCLVITPVCCN